MTSERDGADARLTMTVDALAQLRREGVAHTDDSAKYEYELRGRRYGAYGRASIRRSKTRIIHPPPPSTWRAFSPAVFPPCQARVLALFDGAALVPRVEAGQRCAVILDRTSFYAEQGGQDADRGYFVRDDLQVSCVAAAAAPRPPLAAPRSALPLGG